MGGGEFISPNIHFTPQGTTRGNDFKKASSQFSILKRAMHEKK